MLRKTIICTLFLGFTITISAQKKELKVKFGKISDEEFAMTSHKDDPNAPAVILFDKGSVEFNYSDNLGFVQEFKRHVRIKIFKKEAYDLANVAIPYYDGNWTKQRITDLKAVCYVDKNQEIAMKSESVFDESLTKQRKIKKFTIPGVKEGCIIEYKYAVSGQKTINIPDWTFQHLVPTVWSEFEAQIPQHFIFSKMSQGYTPYSITEEEQRDANINLTFTDRSEGRVTQSSIHNVKLMYRESRMRFVQENVPAFKSESFIGSPYDYLTKLMFQIKAVYDTDVQISSGNTYRLVNTIPIDVASSWEHIGKEMLTDSYADAIESDRFTKEIIQQTIAGKTTAKEKANAIYDYIGKNYKFHDYDYIGMTQSLKDLTTNHTGTATEVNILLINMLQHAGIKAYPVMLSTRSNGRLLSWYPQISSLNRVIAAVSLDEKEDVLIDMHDYPQPLGLIPFEDLNGEGLLLKSKEEIAWIPLQNKVINRKAVMSNLTLSTEGVLSGDVTVSTSGYEAVENRKAIKAANSKVFAQNLLKELLVDGSLEELKLDNIEAFNEPNLKGNYKIKTSAFVNKTDNKIYILPMLCFGKKENPFKDPERKLDINMGAPSEEGMSFIFKLPEGYKVDEMPQSARMKLNENDLTFDYTTENKDNQIKVNVRYKLKKTNYSADEYAVLRKFYGEIVSKMGEQIVLSKI